MTETILEKSRNSYGVRTIPYSSIEQLREDIAEMYPAVSHVTLIDLDDRDEEHIPYITAQSIRGVKITHHKTTGYYGVTEHTTGQWRFVVVVAEKGRAIIKIGKCSIN